MFLCPSWLSQCLKLPLVLMTLAVLRCAIRVFCRMPLCWDMSDAFLMIILELQFWTGGRLQRLSALLITLCRWYILAI